MSFIKEAHEHFEWLSQLLFKELTSDESLSLNLSAEDSTFIRFNQSLVRQNTQVRQLILEMNFFSRGRKVDLSLSLSLEKNQDAEMLLALLARARGETLSLPEDPFATALTNNGTSYQHHQGQTPTAQEVIQTICESLKDVDMAGLLAMGPVIRANMNSKGQSHWFSTERFVFDYSIFTVNVEGENKATRGVYSDTEWKPEILKQNIARTKEHLPLLKKPSIILKPGEYRAFLSSSALKEMTWLLSWRAFSHGAMKKGACALAKFYSGEISLSPKLSFYENFGLGLTPQFNNLGELSPEKIPLITEGHPSQMLTSSRTGKEFQLPHNAADTSEGLRTPEMAPGNLEEKEVLSRLGTGIYLTFLHYLNWSDEQNARFTGMTRYASFWVENGKIVGPIKDMRFDDTLYRVFGSELEDVTKESSTEPLLETYFQRSIGGRRTPGVLLRNFRLTL